MDAPYNRLTFALLIHPPGRGLGKCAVSCSSARSTHDAQCFSLGFYMIGQVNGQIRVTAGTLPLGVGPVCIVCGWALSANACACVYLHANMSIYTLRACKCMLGDSVWMYV